MGTKGMPTTGIEPVIFACREVIQVQRISHYAKQALKLLWAFDRRLLNRGLRWCAPLHTSQFCCFVDN